MIRRGETQIMDEDEIEHLLVSTKDEPLTNREYKKLTGLSRNALSLRKQRYGVSQPRGNPMSRRRDDTIGSYKAVECIVRDGDKSIPTKKLIDKAINILKKRFPELDKSGIQLVRSKLRRNYVLSNDKNIDCHSGAIYGLRLPFNRLIEAFD